MISLISIPERVIQGETLKVKLDIQGKINIKTYKGVYFNLTIKKNGGNLGNTILYPLRFNGNPIEWEINPYSYMSDGTFNVNCTIQDGTQIVSTTFVVEPDCIIQKINTCNNLTTIEQSKRFKDSYIKKQEIPIDYTYGCQIEKPKSKIKDTQNIKEINTENIINQNIFSKVQKAYKNV